MKSLVNRWVAGALVSALSASWGLSVAAEPASSAPRAVSSPAVSSPTASSPRKAPLAAEAGERCEDAVSETIARLRGRDAKEVQFIGTRRSMSPGADDETGVKGEGRYRNAARTVPFTYSCTYNIVSGQTSGVVLRDTGGAPAPEEKAWQPDLTNISPDVCESAAAASLKDRHPRVNRVTFGSDTRQLRPGPSEHVILEGRGAIERAPGMNAVPFSYRCEIETRRGRVVDVRTAE